MSRLLCLSWLLCLICATCQPAADPCNLPSLLPACCPCKRSNQQDHHLLPVAPLSRTRRNPCDENKYYVGFMDVVTNSSNCSQTWVETEGFNSTV